MLRRVRRINSQPVLWVVCLMLAALTTNALAGAEPVIGPTCNAGQRTQNVSFVHVSDLHANFDLAQDKYSRIRAFLESVRQENPYVVFSNSGDDHEKGSIAEQYSAGIAVTEATRAMRFDVRTIGNHDFAWGDKHLLDFSFDAHSMVLMSNTQYVGPDTQGLGSVKYGVIKLGCLRVGFFGMVSPPWDELDRNYVDNYFPTMHTTYDYVTEARRIVNAHRNEVDLMVMVSHLGIEQDILLAKQVNGIDLVLGGHSHQGPSLTSINHTQVVQPDFYADGVTRIDMNVDLSSRKIISFKHLEQPVKDIHDADPEIHQAISRILKKYAPDAQKTIAYLEHTQNIEGLALITAKAGIKQYHADAALLDPIRVNPHLMLSLGNVTAQTLIDSYFIERQKPNTPGINALYSVEVSGQDLRLMQDKQPAWIYAGPTTLDANKIYKVIVHKGAALQPDLFFQSTVSFKNVALMSEAWEALASYAIDRTANCLSLDTDTPPPSCQERLTYSQWSFSDPANPLQAQLGLATLSYLDKNRTGRPDRGVVFGNASSFSLPALSSNDKRIMGFPAFRPDQGLMLTHNAAPNGYFASKGLVSNYTLVMDVLWPSKSTRRWRALLQTSSENSNDADWFVDDTEQGGLGITILSGSAYFGSLPADNWHRIALVVRAANSGGTLQYYINGRLVGEHKHARQRWALADTALLFADDSHQTANGYVANIIFADYAMSKSEIDSLAKVVGSL